MKRGLFVTFEGGEGAGKSTQIKRLTSALPHCLLTREPGGTPEAEALRELFIAHQGQNWPLQAQLLLMFTARTLHTEDFIKPALAKGQTVLCDRYTDSTRVYQGYAGGISQEEINDIKQSAIGDFEPDITFVLDIPVEEGLKRAALRGGAEATFETKNTAFHEKLRQGFLTIARDNPYRCVIIDAMQDEETVANRILEVVRKRLESCA